MNWYQEEVRSSKGNCVCGSTPAMSRMPAVCADFHYKGRNNSLPTNSFISFEDGLPHALLRSSKILGSDLGPVRFLTEMLVFSISHSKNNA
jgi:hypothetical protein